jgi:hypothetical protein
MKNLIPKIPTAFLLERRKFLAMSGNSARAEVFPSSNKFSINSG